MATATLSSHCSSVSSGCRWSGAASGSMEKGEEKTPDLLFNSCKTPQPELRCPLHTSSSAHSHCSVENWSLFSAAMGNVWYWAAFVTGAFGKVAAWSQRLCCVNTDGLPLHFAPKGSCSDVLLCQLKIHNPPTVQDQTALASVVPFVPRIVRFPPQESRSAAVQTPD